MKTKWLLNATLIHGERLVEGHLAIRDGRIAGIYPEDPFYQLPVHNADDVVDLHGCDIMPSMIDLHHDAYEKIWQPRPGVWMPLPLVFETLDVQAAACGIGTVFHAITCSGQTQVRTIERVQMLLEELRAWRSEDQGRIRHRVHLRWEIPYQEALGAIAKWMERGMIDLFSVMDHSPGQGKMLTKAQHDYYLQKLGGASEIILQTPPDIESDRGVISQLEMIGLAKKLNIPVLAHDVMTAEEVLSWSQSGVSGCEFPLQLSAAVTARQQGMHVIVGSPNALRGISHEAWLSARDAVNAGVADVMVSDYYPPSLLPAVYALHDAGIPLPQATALVTAGPATLLGDELCSADLRNGSVADLLVIGRSDNGIPYVHQLWRAGSPVYHSR